MRRALINKENKEEKSERRKDGKAYDKNSKGIEEDKNKGSGRRL